MNIDYQLVKSKRKSIAIQVKFNGAVIVRAPLKISKLEIEQFIYKHKEWIQERVSLTNTAAVNSRHYYYLGKPYTLRPDESIAGITFEGNFLVTNFNAEQIIAWYYGQARILVQPFIAEYMQIFHLTPSAIKINAARKRWGSCSVQGNISFSYRIAMLPESVIQYIVAHELAHLKHHNHSPAFWKLVEQLYPEYKAAHQWLKQHQYAIASSLV